MTEKKELDTDVGKLVLGNVIGKGGFATVYQALQVDTGKMLAVKELKLCPASKGAQQSLLSEIQLLRRLSHPAIVAYITFIKMKEYLYIAMELVESGSLLTMIQKFGCLPESLIAKYIYQVLDGLDYLHSQGVIHRDIKAANILVTKDGSVKIADFGVAVSKFTGEDANDGLGTPYWMAPEVIEMSGVTTKADIWSVGCTVIELATGKPPYFDLPQMSALFHIVQDDSPIPEGVSFSQACTDWLTLTFKKDPIQRWSASKLLKHRWMKEVKSKVGGATNANLSSVPQSQPQSQPQPQRQKTVLATNMKMQATTKKESGLVTKPSFLSVFDAPREKKSGTNTLTATSDNADTPKVAALSQDTKGNAESQPREQSTQSDKNTSSSNNNNNDDDDWDNEFGDSEDFQLSQPTGKTEAALKLSLGLKLPQAPKLSKAPKLSSKQTKKKVHKEAKQESSSSNDEYNWDSEFGDSADFSNIKQPMKSTEAAPKLSQQAPRLSRGAGNKTRTRKASKGSSENDEDERRLDFGTIEFDTRVTERLAGDAGDTARPSAHSRKSGSALEKSAVRKEEREEGLKKKASTPIPFSAPLEGAPKLGRQGSRAGHSHTVLLQSKVSDLQAAMDEDWDNDFANERSKESAIKVGDVEVSGMGTGLQLKLSSMKKEINWDKEENDEDADDVFDSVFDDDDDDDEGLNEKREQTELSTRSINKTLTLLDEIAAVDMKKRDSKVDQVKEVLQRLDELKKIFSTGLRKCKENCPGEEELFFLKPEDKHKIIRQFGASKFFNVVEATSKNEQCVAPLVQMLTEFIQNAAPDLIAIFCVVGILSKVLSISRHTIKAFKESSSAQGSRVEILLAVSRFADTICRDEQTSTAQMFIACDGLRMLISVLGIDDHVKSKENEGQLRVLSEKMITEISEISCHPESFGSNKVDLCKLLINGKIISPLLKHLSRVSKVQQGEHPHCVTRKLLGKSTSSLSSSSSSSSASAGTAADGRCGRCEALSAQIFSILLLLSYGDMSVKKNLCTEKALKTLFGLCPTLSPASRVSLFKLLCNLSSDPGLQKTLIDAGIIQFVVPLINESNSSAKELNYLLLSLNYYTLPGQTSCHSAVIKAGALPYLIFHAKSKAPYKELAITTLLRVCSSADYAAAFLSSKAIDELIEIAKQPQFTSTVFEKLALFINNSDVYKILAEREHVQTLAAVILGSEPETLGSIALSMNNLIKEHYTLAAKIGRSPGVLGFLVDKLTRKALTVAFKVEIAHLIRTLVYGILKQIKSDGGDVLGAFESEFKLLEPLKKARDETASGVMINGAICSIIKLLEDPSEIDTKKKDKDEKKKQKKLLK